MNTRRPPHPALPQRPLAMALAVALACGVPALSAAGPSRLQGPPPSVVEVIAGRDTSHLHGWRAGHLPDPARSQRVLDAWRARPAMPWPTRLLQSPAAPRGATIPVSNCNDAGPGSLRAAADAATDGDVVDLTSLACSQITLTSGEVVFEAPNVRLEGPGAAQLSISGNSASDVLVHVGNGTVTVDSLTIRDGFKYEASGGLTGGCISSLGHVELVDSTVTGCTLLSTAADGQLLGGAIYAAGDVGLVRSAVTGSSAANKYASSLGRGTGRAVLGGGVFARGTVTLIDSLVNGNTAYSIEGDSTGGGVLGEEGVSAKYSMVLNNAASMGGGVWSGGTTSLTSSAVSDNEASIGGGLLVSDASATVSISNSTVSGNQASGKYGGAGLSASAVSIGNSTITGNACTNPGDCSGGGGVHVLGSVPLTLRSSIVAGNTAIDAGQPVFEDITGTTGVTITGDDNLVIESAFTLPADTIASLPKLTGLRDNGGRVLTHALRGNSRALNAGHNQAGLQYDQRGNGFPRTSGPRTDIGSFEMTFSEPLFANDFGGD